nr:Krueppel-like factor 17 isoform X2 [Microcebus murinus]
MEQEAEEQGAEELSQWPGTNQPAQGNENVMSISEPSPPSGTSGVHTSWNHGIPDIQHFPQGREVSGTPLVSAEGADPNSRAQEGARGRKPLVLRPYVCQHENCGKAYTKRSHLVNHERKHTGERPYKCTWEDCTWSFFRSDELGRHIRIHTRYRPYKCRQCGRLFMRSDHLKQHQRTHQQMPGP